MRFWIYYLFAVADFVNWSEAAFLDTLEKLECAVSYSQTSLAESTDLKWCYTI